MHGAALSNLQLDLERRLREELRLELQTWTRLSGGT
jgi:hypothetical protein